MKISLLDCTLRDGAYIVDSQFGSPAIRGIISKLQDAGVDIIECGWLKNTRHQDGSTFYHEPNDLKQYLTSKDKKRIYVAMIDWDRYDLAYLPDNDGTALDAIRIVFPQGKHREGIEVGKRIREKGYQIYFQAANTLGYSDEELCDLADAINEAEPVALSVVDTFGAMYAEDLERIVQVLDKRLKPQIKLGFHSHNNQQLSFALTMRFVQMLGESGRDIVVDASLCGMGRGAGNATTELVTSFLNRKCGCHYNLDAILDAIDIYMEHFKENYQWGYSTPYFISGMYCCHVNNIAYLLKNHRTSAKDMKNIIGSLSAEDRKHYDYDLLEQKYLKNKSYYVDDTDAVVSLGEALRGKKVLLIAPGKSSIEMQGQILRYIGREQPVVIGVNAILPGYRYDYVFFSNSARYEYAKDAYTEQFNQFKRIVLSNVKNMAEAGEIVIGFNRVIKRGWPHFDNAAICCLRMMDVLGLKKVTIAGFDGFKTRYNESYADAFLPSLNPDNKWDELNEEITEIYVDFKRNAKNCEEVEFLTPSIFDV